MRRFHPGVQGVILSAGSLACATLHYAVQQATGSCRALEGRTGAQPRRDEGLMLAPGGCLVLEVEYGEGRFREWG